MKEDKQIFVIDEAQRSLVYEALKNQDKKVREERFYSRIHPEAFYNIYLKRYDELMGIFSGKPRVVKKDMKF